jgi:hypothetical protein
MRNERARAPPPGIGALDEVHSQMSRWFDREKPYCPPKVDDLNVTILR